MKSTNLKLYIVLFFYKIHLLYTRQNHDIRLFNNTNIELYQYVLYRI